jgi:hypothetical protein
LAEADDHGQANTCNQEPGVHAHLHKAQGKHTVRVASVITSFVHACINTSSDLFL